MFPTFSPLFDSLNSKEAGLTFIYAALVWQNISVNLYLKIYAELLTAISVLYGSISWTPRCSNIIVWS